MGITILTDCVDGKVAPAAVASIATTTAARVGRHGRFGRHLYAAVGVHRTAPSLLPDVSAWLYAVGCDAERSRLCCRRSCTATALRTPCPLGTC